MTIATSRGRGLSIIQGHLIVVNLDLVRSQKVDLVVYMPVFPHFGLFPALHV